VQKELRKDGELQLQLGIAKELGMTLTQLMHSMTYEELYLWSAYFANQNEDREKEMAKSSRR
jgi:hypothetical protein